MAYWLMKAEPDDYAWERLVADGETEWTGVRNYQAALNMRAMRLGERVFFYRSVVEPAIVGVMAITREAYPNPDEPDGKFRRVGVRALMPAASEVTLKAIKADPRLADLALVRQSRLSVSPVSDQHWKLLMKMAGGK